ncbi:MAG TPA: OB-fold nucleic acid binding domain-containing protein, partial [Acidimicrobiales bacterium]|nr:OB-fold nucleic acid binding domain-containing protein [Acidimicrobiales bacterium]
RLKDRLFEGMAARGVPVDVAEQVYAALSAFANFGFPESHSVAFAHLVYSTAWCKLHYPAAFCAGLLNAQPMGFWPPQSLVADAKRHGVVVRRPHVNAGTARATLEPVDGDRRDGDPGDSGVPTPAVRLGLVSVRGIGEETAERIAGGRPWASLEDLVRRAGTNRAHLEALATAGALDGLGPSGPGAATTGAAANRRPLVWAAGAASQATADRLPGVVTGSDPPSLPAPTDWEGVADDLWSLGMAPDVTAMELAREGLCRRGVLPAAALASSPAGERVTVGGIVTHRQQPESARGAVFLNLEDETGMVNVVCSRGAWVRWRPVARSSPALVVRGRVERAEGSMTLVAERFEPLELGPTPPSRDFR